MPPLNQHRYFFDQGIRFGCQCCGACCTGAPGIVRVSPPEIDAIAAYLDRPVPWVVEEFVAPWEHGLRIREYDDGRCILYENGCRIYPVRPGQCQTFPFWFVNLRSEARWRTISQNCPGIGTGRRYTRDEILTIVARSM